MDTLYTQLVCDVKYWFITKPSKTSSNEANRFSLKFTIGTNNLISIIDKFSERHFISSIELCLFFYAGYLLLFPVIWSSLSTLCYLLCQRWIWLHIGGRKIAIRRETSTALHNSTEHTHRHPHS